MTAKIKTFVSGLALSALSMVPLASVGVTALIASADAAFAERGGNGNGNGNGRANRASNRTQNASANRTTQRSNGNGNGNGNGHARTAPAQTEVVSLEPEAPRNHGAVASELKGLNAAHANPNAFLHANPDSQVGKIGTYYFARQEADAALQALIDAGLTPEEILNGEAVDDALIAEQLAALDPNAEGYDPLAAEALLTELGYGGFDLLDPASPTYAEDYAALLADLSTIASDDLKDQLLLGDYLDAKGDTDAALGALLPDGRVLSPAAMAEFHRLLGLTEPCPAEDPLCGIEGEPQEAL